MEETNIGQGPLEVGDKLDIYSVTELHAMIRQAASCPGELAIDLGGRESIHTAALQLLVAAARHRAATGHGFRLAGLSTGVATLLRLTGLEQALGVGTEEGLENME